VFILLLLICRFSEVWVVAPMFFVKAALLVASVHCMVSRSMSQSV
jgi:hypothetical protein